MWRSLYSDEAAPLSAGLSGAVRPPQELFDESIRIGEGGYKYYSFELYTSARVRVEVYTSPAHVNVMLMTPSDFEGYQQAMRNAEHLLQSIALLDLEGILESIEQDSGIGYTRRELLSSENVVQYDRTEMLPSGEWIIVVERPLENVFSPQSTTANITITVY